MGAGNLERYLRSSIQDNIAKAGPRIFQCANSLPHLISNIKHQRQSSLLETLFLLHK